jgi:hypothetical protein
MVDVLPLTNIDGLRPQRLRTMRYHDGGVCIFLYHVVSSHRIPVTLGTHHNCLVGFNTNDNIQVLTRLSGIRRNGERNYGGGVPCIATASNFTSRVSRRENPRTTGNVGLIAIPCLEFAQCTKVPRSSESGTGECEGEEGNERKASHGEEEVTC